jgi:uncharacterized protein YbbC (DUF1343 family)
MNVLTGLDRFEELWPETLRGAGVGLLVHPASVNRELEPAVKLFQQSEEFRLTALFGPQHGIRAETQDNMIEWEGFIDKETGLPVYSLYGRKRKPDPSMLNDMDVMVIDLQDVGSRYYTYIWTMDNCFEACADMKKSVVVLDRPNPLGALITEGPVLDMNFSSFVGMRQFPVRHGMTIGEIAGYLKSRFYPSLDLHVIPMKGWKRDMWFDDTGLPWIMPSPNMPTLDSAIVYLGMCLLEGTNLSEGRGTTRPFEILGAPFIDPGGFTEKLTELNLPGVIFRPLYFQPTFQKFSGQLCGGVQLHVTGRDRFRPFLTGAAVIRTVHDLYPDHFKWKMPPYEYEAEKMPIDILAGTDRFRRDIEEGETLESMEKWWQEQCMAFNKEVREGYLIYK